MNNFVKFFKTEAEATKFADKVGGKMVIRYDYDEFYGLIEEFTVEY